MGQAVVVLKKGEGRTLKAGGMWVYDNEIAEAHRNADIHIHDLSMLTGYCAGLSIAIQRFECV